MFNPESSRNFKDTWSAVLPPEKKPGVQIPGPEVAPANDQTAVAIEDFTDEAVLQEEQAPPVPKPWSETERVLQEIEAEKRRAGEIW